MNVFISVFTAEANMCQHALIRPAKNESVRFVMLLIRSAEMNVFVYLALEPAKNERVCFVSLSVVFINKKFHFVLIRPAENGRVHLMALPAFTAETQVF